MSDRKEIRVPDIGDFENVEIIEVLAKQGDTLSPEDPLITLETDKASMDVPAPFGGTLVELKVGKGDRVSKGDVIAVIEAAAEAEGKGAAESGAESKEQGKQAEAKQAKAGPNPSLNLQPAPYRRRGPPTPTARPTRKPTCWCSAPAPAATPPRFAPPTSAARSRSSSAGTRSAACA
jgi:pyruvate dehydrogenase E2 component (dihydrolipoamide acetyltransferase)